MARFDRAKFNLPRLQLAKFNFKIAAGRLIGALSLSVIAVASLLAFSWPLLLSPQGTEAQVAQSTFLVLMPALLVLLLLEASAGSLTAKELAILAVLIALNALIRLLGAGVAGVETVFALIVLAGFAFGPSFGLLLGSLSLLTSALLTAGVGPWLPFQMMAAGLVGLGAGLVAKPIRLIASREKPRWYPVLGLLACYAIAASYFFGAVMTMWNWPYLAGTDSSISFDPELGPFGNLQRFWQFQLLTGGILWDTGRAITTTLLIFIVGKPVLISLERISKRVLKASSLPVAD